MKECPKCKAIMEDDALFCGVCGTKFDVEEMEPHAEEQPVIEEKYCIHCGKAMEADSLYCPYCGKPQEVEEIKPEVPQDKKQEEEPLQNEEPTYEWEEEKKSKTWLWILGAVLLLGILGGGYYLMNNQEEGEDVSAYVQETDSIQGISVSSDETPIENVEQRLKEILTTLIKDNGDRYLAEYFTEGFDAYYNRAWEKANKEGVEGPRIWWQYSDDYPTDFSINSINTNATSETVANITVKGGSCHGVYDVSLKIENGHWKIDRITEIESNSKEVKGIEDKKSFIEEMYDVFFGSRKPESYDIANVKNIYHRGYLKE